MSDLELFRVSGGNIKSLGILTQNEADTLAECCSKLITFQKHHALIEYVIYNFKHLNNSLVNLVNLSAKMELNNLEYPFSNFYFEINTAILNLLASARTFLDHMQTHFERSSKSDRTKIETFKIITANEFDTKFSYKFMGKLRNFVQHCGMPPISYNLRKFYSEKDTLNTELTLMFDRDFLLKEYDSWGAHAKPQLEAQNAEFPVITLVNEYIYSLINIYVRCIEDDIFLEII
ncbi:hypothetical protein, partial [Citrobacter amalonaticus]|uniref:hypothetical protein n=1 Tax=Citrobacter amalonaticus TaxID=35703 RepID=UPI0004D4ADA8